MYESTPIQALIQSPPHQDRLPYLRQMRNPMQMMTQMMKMKMRERLLIWPPDSTNDDLRMCALRV
jgi:hypothetical protein